MDSGEHWRLGQRPALDGLRGVAILLVVGYHSGGRYEYAAGVVGVTAFFTLSGFLITALLLEERDRSGTVSFRGFYARRARRLFPALAMFLVAMTTLQLVTHAGFANLATLPAVILYGGNWLAATGSAPLEALGHTWSLAVEEQFYIVWPLLFVLAIRRGGSSTVARVAAVGVTASVTWRLVLWLGGHHDRLYYGTDTSAAALLLGCLVAGWVRSGWRLPSWIAPAGAVALVAVGMLRDPFLAGPLLAAAITATILLSIAGTSRARGLEGRWLTLIGRRSYGLYLWHFPLLLVVLPRLALPRPVGVVVLIAVAWGLTELSWRLVEAPMLRRGRRRPERAPAYAAA